MNVQIFTQHAGTCPYLPRRQWHIHRFEAPSIPEGYYEQLISRGWRRNSTILYQNCCPTCARCIPLRVSSPDYRPSKSQRRVIRRNTDLSVSIRRPEYRDEHFDLYWRYQQNRHPGDYQTSLPLSEEEQAFKEFFCTSNIDTIWMEYRNPQGRLLGLGLVDLLPRSLSSVYFIFEPQERRRSLGTFSIISEILTARNLEKPWHHLGFWVPGSPKMEYKAEFLPHQVLGPGGWQWRHKKTDPVPLPRIRNEVSLQ